MPGWYWDVSSPGIRATESKISLDELYDGLNSITEVPTAAGEGPEPNINSASS